MFKNNMNLIHPPDVCKIKKPIRHCQHTNLNSGTQISEKDYKYTETDKTEECVDRAGEVMCEVKLQLPMSKY